MCVVAGALWAHPWPRWLVIAALVAWPVARWLARAAGAVRAAAAMAVPFVALVVLASDQSARAWAGLRPPASTAVRGWVTLVADPDPVDAAVRVEARVGRRRAEAWLRGPQAAAIRPRLSGEQVWVRGRLGPLPEKARRRLAPRHIGARLTIAEIGDHRPGSVVAGAANAIRRSLQRGAASMTEDQRALFTGVVLGDDREQDDGMVADFRASGLGHLLAVSGQNVAFVLLVAQPLLRRMGLLGRLAASLAVIAAFGTLTRWEPSVLRAAAMASASLVATTAQGWRPPPLAVLGFVVAGLVMIDPMLARSLGFQLSAAACVGITLLHRRVCDALPGPRFIAEPLALTVSAQAGVAPLLIPAFGSLPLASLPANLAAAPMAGFLMGWGLVAGLAAGLAGEPVATALHLPSRFMLTALAEVASWSARLPLGQVRAHHLWVLGGALSAATAGGAVAVARWPPRAGRAALAAGVVAVVAVVAAAAVVVSGPAAVGRGRVAGEEVAAGARLWRGGATVLVIDGASSGRVVDGLRVRGVRRVDVVVSLRGTMADVATLTLLRGRVDVGQIVAPTGGRVAGWHPGPGSRIRAGPWAVDIAGDTRPLRVEVTRPGRAVAGVGAGR